MFIHLSPLDSDPDEEQIVTQYNGTPSTMQRLTLTWDDTNELYLGPKITLQLPPTLKRGTYRLRIGLYNYLNGQRLLSGTGEDSQTILVQIGATQTVVVI